MFGSVTYSDNEGGWEKGTVELDCIVDFLDGLVGSIPGSLFGAEVIEFIGAVVDKSMRAREWAIRQQVRMRGEKNGAVEATAKAVY